MCCILCPETTHCAVIFVYIHKSRLSGNRQLQDSKLILTPVTKSPGADYLEVYNQLHPAKEGNGL